MKTLKLPLLTSLMILTSSLAAQAWELSDVSVLIPLPATASQMPLMLSPVDRGLRGPLLSAGSLKAMPRLVYKASNADTFKANLKVVGFRFDPCFTEGTGQIACRKQIRMIWQPVVKGKTGFTTQDAALHSFYDFNDVEFAAVVKSYQNLLRKYEIPARSSALSLNPRFGSQRLQSAFWGELRTMLLKVCGENNLTRVTAMTLETGDNDWKFLGVNIDGGKISAIEITGIQKTVQRLVTTSPKGFELTAVATPDTFEKSSRAIYQDSAKAKTVSSRADFQKFSEEVLSIENPALNNPGTTDCASCHMAGPAHQWSKLNVGSFPSNRDLTNTTISNLKPRRFRAFGYFDDGPLFAQRTINESAIVAETMERLFPSKGAK